MHLYLKDPNLKDPGLNMLVIQFMPLIRVIPLLCGGSSQ